jgi:lipopolysaccharide biosynthesis regulator YciM
VATLARHHLQANALDRAEAALASWPTDAPVVPALEALRGECERRRGNADAAAALLARAAGEHLQPRTFRCRACGDTAAPWRARCPRCGAWDTFDPFSDAVDGTPSVALMPSPRRSADDNHCVTETPG